MKKIQLALVASLAIGTSAVPAFGQAHHRAKHVKLKSAIAGVAAYEVAKHSHNRFLHKHRFAAGVVGAMTTHHYLKKRHH